MSAERYAVFFSPPPGSQTANLGATWLGRDVDTGHTLPRPQDHAEQLTAKPRGYGFHATLRAPFRPVAGVDRLTICNLVASLARRLSPATIPILELRHISNFIALVPAAPCPTVDAIAAACIQDTESIRAPLDNAELARRRSVPLTFRQMRFLARWGYPYVMEDFQFHMTVAGPVDAQDAREISPALESHFKPLLARPLQIDALSLFYQAAPDQNFLRVAFFPLNRHAPVILPSPRRARESA